MSQTDLYCHTTTIDVTTPADLAFEFMADGLKHSQWAFGSANRRLYKDDILVGTSMYSGRDVYVRVVPDREKLLVHGDTSSRYSIHKCHRMAAIRIRRAHRHRCELVL